MDTSISILHGAGYKPEWTTVMNEYWLQRYIKEHYQQIGFTEIHGPYKYGADFKGVHDEKPVKIEAEWEYTDYISHKHSPGFADVLVVATLEPVPRHLKGKLPAFVIHLSREQVEEWAQPRMIKKDREDYYSYPWRKFSRSLLCLYAYHRKLDHRKMDFVGAGLMLSMNKAQKPAGFQFGTHGKEEGFKGTPEDKASWNYWLTIAHAVSEHFNLKPALLRPTWVDRVALYFNHTGRITEGESRRFKDIAVFIDDLILQEKPEPPQKFC